MASRAPSRTAMVVCALRALEAARPLGVRRLVDEHAKWFLPAPTWSSAPIRVAAEPEARLVARLSAGVFDDVVLRHARFDERIRERMASGAENLVVLGAGYDSRAWRLARPPLLVTELDRAELIGRKETCIDRYSHAFGPAPVRRRAVDFASPTWIEHLPTLGRRDVVVWEGVTMYLAAEEVRRALRALRAVMPIGATILFDVWTPTGGRAERWGRMTLDWLGEPLRFSLRPQEVRTWLAALGFEVIRVERCRDSTERLDGGHGGFLTLIEGRAR